MTWKRGEQPLMQPPLALSPPSCRALSAGTLLRAAPTPPWPGLALMEGTESQTGLEGTLNPIPAAAPGAPGGHCDGEGVTQAGQ